MHKLHNYIKELHKHVDKESAFIDIMCYALKKLKSHDEEDYKTIMCKLHCLLHGCTFDEETAKEAVSHMRNVDGTVGEHWTYEQAYNLAQQHGIKHVPDFYWAINMLYSDLYSVMGGDVGTYTKMAKAMYFTDPDAPEGKAFKQYMATKH